MAEELEDLIARARPVPGGPDKTTLRQGVPAFSPRAAEELAAFADRYDELTTSDELAARVAPVGRRRT
jgi:hypothetical protein